MFPVCLEKTKRVTFGRVVFGSIPLLNVYFWDVCDNNIFFRWKVHTKAGLETFIPSNYVKPLLVSVDQMTLVI
jgi:hypothetical protein